MKLAELTVKEFIESLASSEPAPGGGSASALAGAVGASLGTMVAKLTLGKKKYAELAPVMNDIIALTTPLTDEMVVGIDNDTDAYNLITDAFSMPKSTDEEKAARTLAIQAALKECTRVPYELLERCNTALSIIAKLVDGFNTNTASDLGVAALNLKTAAHGAWLNVLINIGGLKDEEYAKEHKQKGEALINEIDKSADAIYAHVLTLM